MGRIAEKFKLQEQGIITMKEGLKIDINSMKQKIERYSQATFEK